MAYESITVESKIYENRCNHKKKKRRVFDRD